MFFSVSSCSSQKKYEQPSPQIITVYGKVEVYSDNEIYLVANWKTRSRISYKLIDKKDIQAFMKRENRILEIKAELIQMKGPYNGIIKILEILKEEAPNGGGG
ncbi:MAG: hypothetical protein JW827_01355 [Spirochaetes bacterium]|nr:hypothetical protein [Spirochaetota bacterium]